MGIKSYLPRPKVPKYCKGLNLILVGSFIVDSVATTPWNVPTFWPVADVILSSIVKVPLIAFVREDESGSEFKFKILIPVSLNLLISGCVNEMIGDAS